MALSSSQCESPKLDKSYETNEKCCDTYISITSNAIQSDNDRQFTKLPKQKNRVKDIQTDSVIQAPPNETTHLTNTEVVSSNKN